MTLRFLTAGESHGPALIATLDGLPSGLKVDLDSINADLARRQSGSGAGPRMKMEQDRAVILGGLMGGHTTGAPLAMMIENRDHAHWKGISVDPFTIPRPGHADLTGAVKFGYSDLRPALERASARETATRVAVGSVCRQLLANFGIEVGGYVTSIGSVEANLQSIPLQERISIARKSDTGCPDPSASQAMQTLIRETTLAKDTLGGIIEAVAIGLPVGLGSFTQWDKRLEARIGAAILSIQAIKGVEIGPAFENTRHPGTSVQDAIHVENSQLIRPSNRCGGIEGGISNGLPVIVRAAMKPIATTLTPQSSVNLATGEGIDTRYERSDFCPVPRAVVVVESMLAFVLADALLEKLGGDSLSEMRPRYENLKKMRLGDLTMDNTAHIWWPE
ncbi:chorismate synthase [Leptolinea tardivitalis]|uniref:Chorismate synthase n=1 Tax=Leptolinea tardivitalis TaxID=229920 RepID=A0A0P6XEE2_9CHLR|nr:chorismate synthase [Leptolinea tardivitalis]KPL73207.1 chorismate synthase [Leptolinea tardivitalis]GAP21310.1 chorismate synthase [Leptolinea tardivitalis]